jgi:phenylalanyl-tRNA synthetase alpha subunit
MPPTTEPLSRNFLDEIFFWLLDDEKERQAMRTHTSPREIADRHRNAIKPSRMVGE